ncbi:acyl-CoA thioesterase/bile acid-CoA:amino acid N-acyltransferase family protein [Paractinoplanes atraurantiacus]|uniref:BAAT / Acyl-CoA thioester hydrolase C terminal n=1 Tax=Paractinoplanes atraurantiacus TaxID=1036182 RepID=A0A285KPJ0_9ACTN|nr:acyl-CoA thioesterase/bile acid-CoA:amino acid N-acyltransferase family protein [Actinoplanes atraurantiacus]SNY74535.1 BAAT / Acyl-CoA thioester hydrolase C terminal [Actinoplanes atraurantiacus]
MRRMIVPAALLLLAGCGHGPSAALHVAATTALFDAPLGVTLTGLPAHHDVVVRATATDKSGAQWSSAATFESSGAGTVDPATQAPVSGSYTGTHDTGLLWSMTSEGKTSLSPPPAGTKVSLTATVDGDRVAGGELLRLRDAPGVTSQDITKDFTGTFYAPAGAGEKRPAVLAFGGSEGGAGGGTSSARALAAKGIPALGIGYFDVPGRPAHLERIPLEYFATALRWLAKQPGVDPARMYVYGVSRGSEAALLLGVNYPDLVHGVVAGSPSSVVYPGLPDTSQPAWTFHGKPIPSIGLSEAGMATPPKTPAAVIPVERIRGKIFLLCGDDDKLWPSCVFSGAIAARRGDRPYTEVTEPGAGHYVGDPMPNQPTAPGAQVGGSQQADALGRLDAWPKLLSFLS